MLGLCYVCTKECNESQPVDCNTYSGRQTLNIVLHAACLNLIQPMLIRNDPDIIYTQLQKLALTSKENTDTIHSLLALYLTNHRFMDSAC